MSGTISDMFIGEGSFSSGPWLRVRAEIIGYGHQQRADHMHWQFCIINRLWTIKIRAERAGSRLEGRRCNVEILLGELCSREVVIFQRDVAVEG